MIPRLLKIFPPAAALLVLALVALPASAEIMRVPNQLPGGGPCGFADGPPCEGATTNTIINFLKSFVSMAIALIGILAAAFLVYAGFKYISSRGDEEEAKRAKMQIAYAVIGITVAIGAYAITNSITTRNATQIRNILAGLVTIALTLVGITAVIFLVYAGVKYIMSRGDEEEAKHAKMQITYAVIGIAVALLAVAIANLIITPLGGVLVPAAGVPGAYQNDLISGIVAVVNILLTLVGITAVIFLVYAGVKYIMSRGDEEEAGQAKRQIVYAIIGLTVVALSAAIADLVAFPLLGVSVARFGGTYPGTVEQGVRAVVNALLTLVGIAAIVFIIISGVRYFSAQGDEQALEQAKRSLIFSIIGVVVVVLSAAIINFIISNLTT